MTTENDLVHSKSENVEKTLQKPDIHQEWEDAFRTAENEQFYENVFDYLTKTINAPENSTILDVGCGIGAHSMRLARRGFLVTATDFSEYILKDAKKYLDKNGVLNRVDLKCENILDFSFADKTFEYILCWGVLMHIPDIERAISELDRILDKGGIIVISEGNMHSLQASVLRYLKMLLRREKASVKRTTAGMEYWRSTDCGDLVTRQSNISWLKKEFTDKGYTVKRVFK